MVARCPYCRRKIEVFRDEIGSVCECPQCDRDFRLHRRHLVVAKASTYGTEWHDGQSESQDEDPARRKLLKKIDRQVQEAEEQDDNRRERQIHSYWGPFVYACAYLGSTVFAGIMMFVLLPRTRDANLQKEYFFIQLILVVLFALLISAVLTVIIRLVTRDGWKRKRKRSRKK
jgi:hypothetical protein